MSEPRLVQGRVGRVEWVERNGRNWFLAFMYNEPKPVAFGYDPGVKAADWLGIEVEEKMAWLFAAHRTPAVTPATVPLFDVLGISDWSTKAGRIAEVILGWLMTHPIVSSNDVHDIVVKMFPNNHPSIVGAGFLLLAKKGIIHLVGEEHSKRVISHRTDIKVWELSQKWLHLTRVVVKPS